MSFIKQSWYCKVNETPGRSEKVNKEQPPVLSEFTILLDGKEVIIRQITIGTTPLLEAGMVAQRDADVAWFNTEYPIMYREKADEVGDFIDRGWIPPEQYKINIHQIKVEEREKVLDEIFEEIDTQINKLTEYSNELNMRRQPIIEVMGIRDWIPEEDEFMYSSVREIIEIPNRIALLNNLKQFIKSEYLKESE